VPPSTVCYFCFACLRSSFPLPLVNPVPSRSDRRTGAGEKGGGGEHQQLRKRGDLWRWWEGQRPRAPAAAQARWRSRGRCARALDVRGSRRPCMALGDRAWLLLRHRLGGHRRRPLVAVQARRRRGMRRALALDVRLSVTARRSYLHQPHRVRVLVATHRARCREVSMLRQPCST
jgi:hypothetical protein